MADKEPNADEELDDKGNPIKPGDEGGKDAPPKITSKKDEGGDAKPDDEEEEDVDVPVRKSSLQHIIARKNRTIDKLRSKNDEDVDDEKSEEENEEEEGADDKETLT